MTITQHTDVPFFDTLDPAFRIDAPEVLAAAKTSWYARTPTGPAVLGYDECAALLRDRRLKPADLDFVIAMGVTSGPFKEWLSRFILSLEGEDHIRLRRLVSKAFTRHGVDWLRPFMRAKAHELIDAFADQGECEFMTAFSDLYPAWVIGELIGIAASEFDQFLGWSADLGLGFSITGAQELDRVEAALAGLYACCDELIATRRRQPREDLLSALIAVEEAGDQLSTEELRTMIVGLVFAGQDTTRNQLALAMATFAEHPDQWALLAARPELAVTAVEEVMRVNPVGAVVTRAAVEDVEFNGLAIPAGTPGDPFRGRRQPPAQRLRRRRVRHHRRAARAPQLRRRDALLPGSVARSRRDARGPADPRRPARHARAGRPDHLAAPHRHVRPRRPPATLRRPSVTGAGWRGGWRRR